VPIVRERGFIEKRDLKDNLIGTPVYSEISGDPVM
jgi:hypothetical protein